jgi:hypothetical protein
MTAALLCFALFYLLRMYDDSSSKKQDGKTHQEQNEASTAGVFKK